MQNKLDNGTRTPKYFSEATPRKVLFVYLAAVLPHSLIVMNHANLVMEFFIPLLNRLGSTAPPDVVIGILTAFFVCLMAHFSLSTVHAVQSIKKCFIPLLLLSVLGFVLAFSSYGFPYSYTPSSPITKRLYIQHTFREFYDKESKLIRSDAGLWVNTMDYPAFDTNMGCKYLHAADAAPCTGLYCHFPWLIPIHHLILDGRYLPADKPNVETNPLKVKEVSNELVFLRENATTKFYKKRISFSITGPSHMSVHIGTLRSKGFLSQLTKWSLDGAVDDVASSPLAEPEGKDYKYNKWHFIYYGAGLNPYPWQPWFEFLISQDKNVEENSINSRASAEFGFSGQHYPADRNIPTRGQTNEIRSVISELHDWVMPISWISTYKNYLF